MMLANNKHGPVAVVSVWSLRKAGCFLPVHMAVADDKAQAVAEAIACDPRLAPFTWARWTPPSGMRNSGYLSKTHMGDLTPFEETLFLDADTMVVGDLGPLFDFSTHSVILTQFAKWLSNGRTIRGRIKQWADVAPGDVSYMSSHTAPAINTGVIAWQRDERSAAFMDEWKQLTARKPVFICDELAAQLIFWRHNVKVLDSRYNCSPTKDGRKDAVIYHFHGKKHVNREQGRAIWLPAYEEACKFNLADLRSWTPASDRRLREFLDARDGAGQPDDESGDADDAELTDAVASAQ